MSSASDLLIRGHNMIVANWAVSVTCANGRQGVHDSDVMRCARILIAEPGAAIVTNLACGCAYIGFARIADDPPSSSRNDLAGSTLRDASKEAAPAETVIAS
jgi:hypothetical protein